MAMFRLPESLKKLCLALLNERSYIPKVTLFILLSILTVTGQDKKDKAKAADKDPAITKSQADEILGELRMIRQLLERQSAQPAMPSQIPTAMAQTGRLALKQGFVL